MDKPAKRFITETEATQLENMGWEVCGSGTFCQRLSLGYVFAKPGGQYTFARFGDLAKTVAGFDSPSFADPISAAVYAETLG